MTAHANLAQVAVVAGHVAAHEVTHLGPGPFGVGAAADRSTTPESLTCLK
jgi:hypothetical protein